MNKQPNIAELRQSLKLYETQKLELTASLNKVIKSLKIKIKELENEKNSK